MNGWVSAAPCSKRDLISLSNVRRGGGRCLTSSSMHTHVHLHSYKGTHGHTHVAHRVIFCGLSLPPHMAFLSGLPLTSQQTTRLWLLLSTVEQPVWSGGIPRLCCGSSCDPFLPLGKVREVDVDSTPPPEPATLSGVHGSLPRSLWPTMPKVALSGGDSGQDPVSASVSLGLCTGLVRSFASRHICPGPSIHPGRTDGWYPKMGEPSCGDRHPSVPREKMDASRKVSSQEARALEYC